MDTKRAVEIIDGVQDELYEYTVTETAGISTTHAPAAICASQKVSSEALLDPSTEIPNWVRIKVIAAMLTDIGSATPVERLEIVALMVEDFGFQVPQPAFENLDLAPNPTAPDHAIDYASEALANGQLTNISIGSRNDHNKSRNPQKPSMPESVKAYEMNFKNIMRANPHPDFLGLAKSSKGHIAFDVLKSSKEVIEIATRYPREPARNITAGVKKLLGRAMPGRRM